MNFGQSTIYEICESESWARKERVLERPFAQSRTRLTSFLTRTSLRKRTYESPYGLIYLMILGIADSANGVPIRLPDERRQHILDSHPDLASYLETILDTVRNP